MKTRIIFGFFFLVLMITNGNANEKVPVAVSPGSESGVAAVGQSCPTFSWSAVQGAGAYRVMVFKAVGGEVLVYEEMDAKGYAVINKEIRGPALSWTPSANERLSNGEAYVWYVQAVDAYGVGTWSEGRMFIVEEVGKLVAVGEKVGERLRESGVKEEVITEVLKDFRAGVDVQEIGYVTPGLIIDEGTERGSNTFYGKHAGRITTGPYNSFFGSRAGYYNESGSRNTYIGYRAGYKSTTAIFNTFLGYRAGYSNINGASNTFIGNAAGYKNSRFYNTFLGYAAGFNNKTGQNNTFLGYRAGYNNKTGSDNLFLGRKAGYNEKGSNRLYIDSSDTSSPLIYGRFDTDIVTINGKLGVGMNPTNRIDVTGGAYCNGTTWVDASSRVYKENIESLNADEARDALGRLNPVKFNYKGNKEEEKVGFIAEEVPDLVATKDRKGLSAMDVVAVLTKVVQEQQETILELKGKITELEKKKQEKP